MLLFGGVPNISEYIIIHTLLVYTTTCVIVCYLYHLLLESGFCPLISETVLENEQNVHDS